MRRVVRRGALPLALACAGVVACRGDDRLHDRDEDARRTAGTLALGDSQVVTPLRSPATPGRLIYDAPVDLSFASLERSRPDLLATLGKPPAPAGGVVRRDSTGGDATADTSGGAARSRRPRP